MDRKVAVLVHAGIWKWTTDLETGNFVPYGEEAPEGVPDGQIQDEPSFKCKFSYAFDTSRDTSIWDNIKIFEDHVCRQPGFNKGNRPRRPWQNGRSSTNRDKYIINTRVFANRSAFNTKEGGEYKVPYEVHPWLKEGITRFPEAHQIPNPDRPKYFEFTENRISSLADSNEPTFKQGDIIWMTFKLGFVVTGGYWWPEIIPIEFVRVGKLPEQIHSKADHSLFPSVDESFNLLCAGDIVEFTDDHSPRPVKRIRLHDSYNQEEDSYRRKGHVEKEEDINMNDEPVLDDDYVHVDAPETNSKNRLRSGRGGKNTNRS
uniref:Uncharacterized protein n=1 Tax=Psilocybe cubensis TaxID=181762 RepID=A0A8H8CFA2_PSICU